MSANTRKSRLRRDELLANIGDLVPASQYVVIGTGSRWTTAHATSVGGGTSNHADLTNLSWTASGHTGTASRLAGFNGSGEASLYEIGVDVQAWDQQLADIAALTPTNDYFMVANGTTWTAETPAQARTSMGLGTIATQSAASVTITGGSITGITDLAVADGGTGSSTASGARTNLGVAIGSDVQAWDVNLDQIAALAATDGNVIVGNGSAWVAESGATLRTTVGVGTGDSPTFSGLTLDTAANTTLTIDKGTASIGAVSWTSGGAAGAEIYLDGSEDLYIKAEASDRDIFVELNDGGVNTRFMHFDASLVRVAIGASAPGYHFDAMASNSANGAFVARVYNSDTGTTADALRVEVGAANAGTSNIFVGFYDGGAALIGSITGDGAGVGVVYNTTSDRRWKRDIEPAPLDEVWRVVRGIPVRRFRWRRRPGLAPQVGVIAQEVAEVAPGLVTGPRPGSAEEPVRVAVSPDGERRAMTRTDAAPDGWSVEDITPASPDFVPLAVDYPRMVPYLLAAVQDLSAQLEATRAELAALRVRVG